ncbi:MAG: protein kinase domain-containing protein, partial [Blastocatellia bacterium]
MKTCLKCGKSYPDEQTFCPDDNTSLVSRDAVQEEDPLVGKVLAGRYQITARIARGGMGSVYRAVHTKMNRTCALKLLVQTTPDADSVARFNREAQMASRIDNPHAVTIYDFGEAEDGLLYLAMEYIEGEPLSMTIARERALPLVRVARITSQIAEALSAAHRLGIIHRDLKPDNIMVTRKGGEQDYVKVLDFGIAKVMAEGGSNETLTQTGIVLGTPPYMSPEQLTGEHLDPRSDVYSLALIVYQMICGKLPFSGQTSQTIMMKRLTHDPVKLRENAPFVSELVESVVMTALKRERESRQSSVDQFASELAAALGVSQTATDTRATVPISSVPGSGAEYQGETRGRGTPLAPSQDTEKSRSETEISTVPIGGKGPTSPQNLETDQYLPPSSYVTKRSPQQGLTEDPASSRRTFDDQARPAEPQSGSQQSGGQQSGVTAPYWGEQPAQQGSQPNLVSEPGPPGSRQPIEQGAPPTTRQEVQGSTLSPQPYQQSPAGQQLPSSASTLEPGPTRANSQVGSGQRAIPPTAVFPGSQPAGSQPRGSRAPFVGLGIAAFIIIGCLAVAGYFA